MSDRTLFANSLYEHVSKSGYTLNKLDELAGIPWRTIQGWYSGKGLPRSWEDLLRLAAVLGLSAAETSRLLLLAGHPSLQDLHKLTRISQNGPLLERLKPWEQELNPGNRTGVELRIGEELLEQEFHLFASSVAHTLRGPLAVIIGYAEVIRESYTALPAEFMEVYLDAILRNGRKMSNIIDEMMLLAGIRRRQVELTPLHMETLVTIACQNLAYLVEEYQAEIVLPASSWPVALGYAPWIIEVWINYLSNGIKYGGRPPRVELGASEEPDGMVRFWVHDNGQGLTPDEQAILFTSFASPSSVLMEGYGLGLPIVKRIVENLGGQTGVESQSGPGQGSLFFFTLPRFLSQAAPGPGHVQSRLTNLPGSST